MGGRRSGCGLLDRGTRAGPWLPARSPCSWWGTRLSKEEQGFYYTFSSLLGLSVFFDLALGHTIGLFASHERAGLSWTKEGTLTGESRPLGRLASLMVAAARWYGVVALLVITVVVPVGLVFFGRQGAAAVQVQGWRLPWVWVGTVTAFMCFFTPTWGHSRRSRLRCPDRAGAPHATGVGDTRALAGTGFGLAPVRHAAREHGLGALWRLVDRAQAVATLQGALARAEEHECNSVVDGDLAIAMASRAELVQRVVGVPDRSRPWSCSGFRDRPRQAKWE